jgi:biopolymer transport protein TolQ
MLAETLPLRALAAPVPGILDLLGESGPMALVVLGLLAFLSVVSWAIMIERWRRFRAAEREDRALVERLGEEPRLGAAAEFARHLSSSPLADLLAVFADEVARQQDRGGLGEGGAPVSTNPGHLDPRVRGAIERRLEKSSLHQSRRFQRFLGFLATTATVAPFIGLFGTVWGIMNAFRSIGAAGGASIAAYAPGIAEALVTTAAGLAAAIPAVAGYNYFVGRVRHIDEEMEDFAADLLQRLEGPSR